MVAFGLLVGFNFCLIFIYFYFYFYFYFVNFPSLASFSVVHFRKSVVFPFYFCASAFPSGMRLNYHSVVWLHNFVFNKPFSRQQKLNDSSSSSFCASACLGLYGTSLLNCHSLAFPFPRPKVVASLCPCTERNLGFLTRCLLIFVFIYYFYFFVLHDSFIVFCLF
jgi:hypothetical protein